MQMEREKKKVVVVVLISDKTYFKAKDIVRDKEVHYIMRKGIIHQEAQTLYITLVT